MTRGGEGTQVADRPALITGGSRGLGRAMAIRLAASGHPIVVNYTSNVAAANQVVSEIESGGGTALAVKADVGDESSVTEMIARVQDSLGAPLVLVNNAGITRDQLLLRMPSEDFDRVIETNLRSAFLCTRAVLRGMLKARWGRIVSIASVAGLVGNPGQANYAASKAGMIGFSKSVAKEVGSRNITVNVVAPGYIETDLTSSLSEEIKLRAVESTSLRRLGRASEVATVVDFLASDAASYITGQVIPVDGGLAL